MYTAEEFNDELARINDEIDELMSYEVDLNTIDTEGLDELENTIDYFSDKATSLTELIDDLRNELEEESEED